MKDIIETTATEVTDVRGAEKLANEINAIKRQTMRTVLMASIEIGEKLCEAKALVAHGEWEKWLIDNVDYSQSTANNLMKIYREYGDNQLDLFSTKTKSEIFGNLTYSQAVALFALPAHERESFVESHDMSSMSVRELSEEIERLKSEKDEYADKLSDTERKLDSISEELETAKADIEDAAKAKDDELRAAMAKEEASAAHIKELEAKLSKLDEQAKRGSGDAAVQQFAALFEAFQEDFNRMLSKLSAFEATNPELGGKMRTALGKILGGMSERVTQ